MDERAQTLIKQGDQLFGKRQNLLNLWQEIADNFYPERADFTVSRNLGTDFADNLMTSVPIIMRRDLGDSFAAMLRRDQWFKIVTDRQETQDQAAKEWLEWATKVQYRAMYDRKAQFVRAAKECDHDFATFGQGVIQTTLNKNRNGLLYRTWHLRDVAWCENSDGAVGTIHRKWNPTAQVLAATFPKTVPTKVTDSLKLDPYREVKCQHIIVTADEYIGAKKYNTPYVSIYIDVEDQVVLEEMGVYGMEYTIPRWQTVSGSQYAFSPAAVAGLPDARTIQDMTRVLLEAGEKATNPPMVAVQEAIRGDVSIYAGGITWVDSEYDERLGEVLRPLSQDKQGIPTGMNMRAELKLDLANAWFLNKLNLPPAGTDMTAYEVSQRIQEYIRQVLPILQPAESNYSAAICEETFSLLMRNNAFGPPDRIPDSIKGADVQFLFESPLNAAVGREKVQQFQEVINLIMEAQQIDPTAADELETDEGLRDAIEGTGAPADWLRDEAEVQQIKQQRSQQQSVEQGAQQIAGAAQVAQQVGAAGKALKDAQAA